MAEIITGSKPLIGNVPDVEAQNRETAAKVAAQGRESAAPKVEELAATGDALDALAATKNPDAEPDKKPDETATPAEPTAEEKAAAEKSEAEKKTAEEAQAKIRSKSDEYFKDTPSLPDRASSKSSEAFAAIKIKATQEIQAREEQIEKLKKDLAERDEKLKSPLLTKEIDEELKAHRLWRARLDVDYDPKFQEYDKKINATRDFIYDQLRKSPKVSDATIDAIKKIGGPDKINLPKLFEDIQDPVMQRVVESKVADIFSTEYEKGQAIKEAKANIEQYAQTRVKEQEASVNAHTEITGQELKVFTGALDWYKPMEAKTEAEKANVEEHNKFVAQMEKEVTDALHDNSPRMRAILLTGYLQFCNLKRLYGKQSAELEALKKSNGELQTKWDKVQKSTRSRLPESAAPASGQLPRAEEKKSINTDTSGSLDAIAKSIMEKRQSAGA